MFGTRVGDSEGRLTVTEPAEIRARLDSALTSVFNEDGKRTVLYYMANKFDLTLEQACADPAKLEKALTMFLGELGWMVVKRAILEVLWERKIPVKEVKLVQGASLREAFGFIKGMGPGSALGLF